MDVERIIEQLQEMFEAPTLGHSAQATSLPPIEGTMKRSRIADGFGCGSILASVADLGLRNSD